MAWARWEKGLFGLPPGADFSGDLVQGMMDRTDPDCPHHLALTTIYVNSGRTMRSLREAFDRHAQIHGPILLPKMRLIADLGADLSGPVAARLARRLELGDLVDRLIASEPALGVGQSVPELALSLADLMAEMQSEGCGVEALDQVDIAGHAAHWQMSLRFLRIAAGFYLQGDPVDSEARQRLAAETLAAEWQAGRDLPQAPIIIAGSTGSHGATRLLMEAVAKLEFGAVVLPGFDFTQPDHVWDGLTERSDDHPQARFAPLMRSAGAVRPWVRAQPQLDRNKLISLALRPAPVTDQWIAEGPFLPILTEATQGLTLIEADQPQEEANAISLIIRDAVERNHPVTLFAADRGLVRRVEAALDRWDLVMDDSAGEALHQTAPGLLLRHVAALPGQAFTIDALLVLLKHPLTASASGRGENLRQTRDLELELRANGPAFPDADTLRDWASKGDEDRQIWAMWLSDLLARITAMAEDRAPRPLIDRLNEHLDLAEIIAAGPGGDRQNSRLWTEAAGLQTQAVMGHLHDHAGSGHPMRPAEYADLVLRELQAAACRRADLGHPMVRYCGPREARTEANRGNGALVILAGLNEGGWPQALPADPWLSRQMRLDAGLTLPERLIGLAAHDFQQAIAAPEVILTRARRDADAETIPSRWLNRILNVMAGLPDRQGPEALTAMRDRGLGWLRLTRAFAQPQFRLDPAPRPSPVPPGPAFDRLSVTQIQVLIRDPYEIYAKKVLGLFPLNPLRPEPGAAMRGTVLHEIVERVLRDLPKIDRTIIALRDHLLAQAHAVLHETVPWPSSRAFWMARIEGIAHQIARDEAERLTRSRPIVIEERGAIPIAGLDFKLTAKPDRIDILHDEGTAHVYDYKSGTPPTDAQMAAFDKQLMLEAAMVERGAFPTIPALRVDGLSYIQLGGAGTTQSRRYSADAMAETWDKFVVLVTHYLREGAGFTARGAMQKVSTPSDYDHLSRFGEWGLADSASAQKMRGSDETSK